LTGAWAGLEVTTRGSRRHRPRIRAVIHGRHRRRWLCIDRLRHDCRSCQSDRRHPRRGPDGRRYRAIDSRIASRSRFTFKM